jgi:general secretion pathway protein H
MSRLSSLSVHPNKRRDHLGFTLLEILITMAIIVVLAASFLPRLVNKGVDFRSAVRKLSVVNRDLRNKAKLYNATYRLVLELKKTENTFEHSYWVEKADGNIIHSKDLKEAEEKREKLLADNNGVIPESEKATLPGSPFQVDTKALKKKEVLPGGLYFDQVESGSGGQPVKEGKVYVHFYPTGAADETAIVLSYDNKLFWTIYVHPLINRLEVAQEKLPLGDMRFK